MTGRVLVMFCLATCAAAALGASVDASDLQADFAHPPTQWKTRPLWFWNSAPSRQQTQEIMQGSTASGYAGFGILPAYGEQEFMTPEFLERYGEALDTAAALGMRMCLYDEYWFPSGSAGGQLAREYPEALSKRLDMVATEIPGPQSVRLPLPEGRLMAAVAMDVSTLERIDLAACVADGHVAWDAPAGDWRVMLFTCVTDGDHGLVDYLDPEAVKRFVELTYERYYAAFADHFGSTIDSAFFDEPTLGWTQGCRVWTGDFNHRFIERRGYDPALLYPSLWFDIGPETASARNALFGLRTELYSEGFVGTIGRWCREHSIALTGHQDQEEVANPVGLSGDLMKCFEYQDIPGVDEIFSYGRGSRAYKVVSSAACNYDRPLVMVECYGAMQDMPTLMLYREAMDLFAKGINLMVPHAVWYDPGHIIFPPELSYRDPLYGPALPAYNAYVGRLQRMLQPGRHMSDIAVLYPIATLQAVHRFGAGNERDGWLMLPGPSYMDVGEMLSLQVRRDFTYLHPEVLDRRCHVRPGSLHLSNDRNPETYRILILPNMSVINATSAATIREFYDRGGAVIATTRLPDASAEPGRDAEVREAMAAVFGAAAGTASGIAPTEGDSAGDASRAFACATNGRGGRAYLVPSPTVSALQAVLDDALPVPDVRLDHPAPLPGGNLSYLHKVVDGRHVFFFANSSDTEVATTVSVRGRLTLDAWDPHTGRIGPLATDHDGAATRARLVLPPVRSVFWVSRERVTP